MASEEPQWTHPPADLIVYRPPTLDDLDSISALEAAGYPADEAASPERLKYRIENASDCFLVASRLSDDAKIIGFVCGTLTAASALTEESMGTHEPEGSMLCIHSVCVDESERRKGVASKLLQAYTAYTQQTVPQLKETRLICKEWLVPLYTKAGFEVVGPSPVVHGQDSWIEMKMATVSEDGGEYNEWT